MFWSSLGSLPPVFPLTFPSLLPPRSLHPHSFDSGLTFFSWGFKRPPQLTPLSTPQARVRVSSCAEKGLTCGDRGFIVAMAKSSAS